jgi:hypothetical protein
VNDAPWELLVDFAQQNPARTIDLVWALVVLVATAVLWWWPRERLGRVTRFGSVLGLVLLGVLGLRAWEQRQLLRALPQGTALSAQGPVRFGFSRDAEAPGLRNLTEPPWVPVAG